MKANTFVVALLAFAWAAVPDASALTPRGRIIDGTVLSADHATREAAIKRPDVAAALPFTWNKNTTFVQGANFVDPHAALRGGTQVRVTYHKPLFGPATVSRVVLLRKPSRCCSCC